MSNKTFQYVNGVQPSRSMFDLSYNKKFTADMGLLYPVACEEVIPGDIFHMSNEIVTRMMPTVAPILHEINIFTHYFFVPYRILWEDWVEFITGGEKGDYVGLPPKLKFHSSTTQVGSLLDYLGFPVVPTDTVHNLPYIQEKAPLAFPVMAYNKIWNDYYRDQNLQTEVELLPDSTGPGDIYPILRRSWEKDYFTSALPFQQRGTSPSIPLSGTFQLNFAGVSIPSDSSYPILNDNQDIRLELGQSNEIRINDMVSSTPGTLVTNAFNQNFVAAFNQGTVQSSSLSSFNIIDLRTAWQVQKFMERNARAGVRYTEFLSSHYGVSPRDDRLQRPEYIGGTRSPVIVSEVLQTSSSNDVTPQGNMAGHGITADMSQIGSYAVQEFGVIMGILSIMPKPGYQNGVKRSWLRNSRFEFPFPEFMHLSEQGILEPEIYISSPGMPDPAPWRIFGYQGIYDELRVNMNMTCGLMKTDFNYWHLNREFGGYPSLNSSFIECNPSKRIFAVESEPGFIVNYQNNIRAIRPLPLTAEPGLVDHF